MEKQSLPPPESVRDFANWMRANAPRGVSEGEDIYFLYGAETGIGTWAARVGPQGKSTSLSILTIEQDGRLPLYAADFDAVTGEPVAGVGSITADTFAKVAAAFQNGQLERIRDLTDKIWIRTRKE